MAIQAVTAGHAGDDQPLTRAQFLALLICVLICVVDGYDVQSIAVTSTYLSRDLNLPPRELGVVFSSGLAGMALGSLVLSPFSDRFGRRPMLFVGLVLITLGMLATAAISALEHLIALRFVTGVGMGSLIPTLSTLVAEHSNRKWRNFAVATFATAYPLGSALGGLVAAPLAEAQGWHAIYLLGAALSFILIFFVFRLVPESTQFLARRTGPDALQRLNAARIRLGLQTVPALPPAPDKPPRAALIGIFQKENLGITFFLSMAFIMLQISAFFIMSWTPMILVGAGFKDAQAVMGSVLLSTGGTIGSLALGIVATRWNAARVTSLWMILCFASFVAVGYLPAILPLLLIAIFLIGFFQFGAAAGKFTVVAGAYPVEMRATGVGFALAVGRVGGVIGPYMAGVLISLGWERSSYVVALGFPLVIAALAIEAIRRILAARTKAELAR